MIADYAIPTRATALFSHENQGANGRRAAPEIKEQNAWGIAGDARAVRRTVVIAAADDMTFTPPTFTVRQRETVRLRVKNLGKDLHELVLRTPE